MTFPFKCFRKVQPGMFFTKELIVILLFDEILGIDHSHEKVKILASRH